MHILLNYFVFRM